MDLKLKGKVALITASSKGIGKATAEILINEGCKVVICSSNQKNIIEAASEIKKSCGVEPIWGVCDLNNPEDIIEIVKMTKSSFGDIDILVNNCGGPVPGTFDDLNDENWMNAVDQVLLSVVRMTREILPGMKAKKWGRIINITSKSVKQPIDNLMLSNSLRSAVTAFSKTLSNDVGQHNITVNNVAPGFTLTSRLYELALVKEKTSGVSHEEVLAEMANSVPMKRLGRAEEIASMVVYLASEQAGFITGTTIQVDGGSIKSTY
ncbi:MAG: SDR family oxidoreductase [Melioribacteraceae bacterium]|jgi:3-oxoacyl-[acyl-carrier protein] reductase|nr:SDR family oxidoreductase [Melioribacteraceae bacterium]